MIAGIAIGAAIAAMIVAVGVYKWRKNKSLLFHN